MKVVGLCGGSGSGKSEICSVLSSFAIPIIDADAIYHSITSAPGPCLDALSKEFGSDIVNNGVLDRKALGKIVFGASDSEKLLSKLNDITHPFVLREIEDKIHKLEDNNTEIAVVDIPLLFESGFDKRCDVTVAVIADTEIRISRITKRDGISRESAINRINSQIDNDRLITLTDFQLINNSDIVNLRSSVLELLEKIK